ncbi:MAG: hypothetical protein JJU18_13800 [Oceanicaulis sp.]|nr:hypothetical protein [Oceanicaulis sp.]
MSKSIKRWKGRILIWGGAVISGLPFLLSLIQVPEVARRISVFEELQRLSDDWIDLVGALLSPIVQYVASYFPSAIITKEEEIYLSLYFAIILVPAIKFYRIMLNENNIYNYIQIIFWTIIMVLSALYIALFGNMTLSILLMLFIILFIAMCISDIFATSALQLYKVITYMYIYIKYNINYIINSEVHLSKPSIDLIDTQIIKESIFRNMRQWGNYLVIQLSTPIAAGFWFLAIGGWARFFRGGGSITLM